MSIRQLAARRQALEQVVTRAGGKLSRDERGRVDSVRFTAERAAAASPAHFQRVTKRLEQLGFTKRRVGGNLVYYAPREVVHRSLRREAHAQRSIPAHLKGVAVNEIRGTTAEEAHAFNQAAGPAARALRIKGTLEARARGAVPRRHRPPACRQPGRRDQAPERDREADPRRARAGQATLPFRDRHAQANRLPAPTRRSGVHAAAARSRVEDRPAGQARRALQSVPRAAPARHRPLRTRRARAGRGAWPRRRRGVRSGRVGEVDRAPSRAPGGWPRARRLPSKARARCASATPPCAISRRRSTTRMNTTSRFSELARDAEFRGARPCAPAGAAEQATQIRSAKRLVGSQHRDWIRANAIARDREALDSRIVARAQRRCAVRAPRGRGGEDRLVSRHAVRFEGPPTAEGAWSDLGVYLTSDPGYAGSAGTPARAVAL
jgi:hypothetical protein